MTGEDMTHVEEPGSIDNAIVRNGIVVVVNARAGEVLQRGAEAFTRDIAERFGTLGIRADVRSVPPGSLDRAVGDAVRQRPGAVIVAGGDGTVSRLLPKLAVSGVPVGILPLGTLNLLAADLGFTGRVEEDVPSLADAEPVTIDLGVCDGTLFHSNAGLGYFGAMARAREDARRIAPFSKRLGYGMAALRTLLASRPVTVELEIDGVPVLEHADAVLVTNNRFLAQTRQRETIAEGLLEVHMLRAGGIVSRLQAALAVLRGTWRDLPNLRSLCAREIVVRRPGRRQSTVSIDGELRRVSNPIHLASRPGALRVLRARLPDRPAP